MPFLARITNTFFVTLINRLGVRPPPPEGFELSNVVQPVSIVDTDVVLTSVSSTPELGAPFTAGVTAAPALNTVLADTLAQAAGFYNVRVVACSDEGVLGFMALQRRDAANAANIWSQLIYASQNEFIDFSFRTQLAANERIRVLKAIGNAGVGLNYQVSIWLTPA